MIAISMAGGFGTRMRPLTCNVPKPMLPVANRPVMEHGLRLLKRHGFTDVRVLLYYQPQVIRDHFGDGSALGLSISYVTTETDLGTAGAVRFAQTGIEEPVFVISGDVLTDFDLTATVAFHRERGSKATLVLTRVTNPLAYGVVITEPDGRVVRFLEKPSWGEVFSDTVNTGIYILEPEALECVPPGREFDFSKDLFPALMERGVPLYGCIATGYWRDIGSLSEYRQAQVDILRGEVDVEVQGQKMGRIGKDVWVGEGTRVDPSAKLRGAVVLGKRCRIGPGAQLSNSIVGDDGIVEDGAAIADSVLWDHVTIGAEAELKEDVVASHCTIERKAFLAEGVVVSDHCQIGPEATVKADVKLWPYKTVEEGATLSTSLVWGEKWSRSLFGAYGVSGLTNVEITPEFVAKLGAAYGATLPEGTTMIFSRDLHKSSRLIGRALMSGILSSGVNVHDLQAVPIPVARFAVRSTGDAGGLHVRRSPFDRRLTDIKFFDAAGMDTSSAKEKGIEGLFFREDFRRADAEKTGEITFPQRVLEYYKEALLASVDSAVLGRAKLKVVVDYAFGTAATIFPSVLGELGCEVVALNAYLDETKLTRTADEFNAALTQLSTIVPTLKADLGILMDAGGEKVFLVDETGKILSGDEALASLILLGLKSGEVKALAVPVSASQAIEQMADPFGAEVIRTRMAYRSMMEVAASGKVQFVGEGKGGFIFPRFHPAMDAQCATAKALEWLARAGESLSRVRATIPAYRMVREHIPCQWEMKGAIMRHLIDETQGSRVELVDGVKIFHDGSWVIVVPDGDRPLFHVNAEAPTETEAKALSQRYIDLIRSWQEHE
jgi:mannose-1-phosphate guanylyltransferase/phosphomannomutase